MVLSVLFVVGRLVIIVVVRRLSVRVVMVGSARKRVSVRSLRLLEMGHGLKIWLYGTSGIVGAARSRYFASKLLP